MKDKQNKDVEFDPPDYFDLDPRIDKAVGDKLRIYFDKLAASDVPDRIVDLIMALDAKERKQAGEDSR